MSTWTNRAVSLVAAVAVLGATSLAFAEAAPQTQSQTPAPRESVLLESARRTADWLASVRREVDGRAVWPAHPATPAKPDEITHDLYSGTAGVVLFHIELHRATGDAAHLAEASAGAETLAHVVGSLAADADAGLFTGVAGYGYTLAEAARATGDERFDRAARLCVRHLVETATDSGAVWNGATDIISGDAGIGFFLLYASDRLGVEAAGPLAIRVGDALVAQGRRVDLGDGETGLDWAMTPTFPRVMPNYSHGTAGICDFLLALDGFLVDRAARDASGGDAYDGRFLAAARLGARYLGHLAAEGDGLVCHHRPGGEELFYLGWCHGPAGTGGFLHRLAQRDPAGPWQRMLGHSAVKVRSSGIPTTRPPGFWNNVGVCCGSAGVASFMLDYHRWTGDQAALALARRLTEDLLTRATETALPGGGTGLAWVHAEHRVQPENLAAQTGLMQGAAGIGLWLLRLDAFETGRVFETEVPPVCVRRSSRPGAERPE